MLKDNENFIDITTLSHHAYFIHRKEGIIDRLNAFLAEKFKIHEKQNPDFFHENFITLSIEDSRRIKELHISKSFSQNSKRIFVVECFAITHEAQNALLKIFEEPNQDSHFFLIMPNPEILLPTLRSRLYITKAEDEKGNNDLLDEVNGFLKLSIGDKIAYVDELTKDISLEKRHKGDAVAFLDALTKVIYEKTDMKNITIKEKQTFNAILKAKDYINDRSPSIKQLLEYVAVSI